MPRAGAQGRTRGQAGQSLIEVIIAITLLASVFFMISVGLLTVTRGTKTNKNVQAIDSALVAYGEILQTQVTYFPCPGSGTMVDDYFLAAEAFRFGGNGVTTLWRKPTNIAVSVISVKSWNPVTQTWNTGCPAPDTGAQRLTYRVTKCPGTAEAVPGCANGVNRTAEVVVRKKGPS